MDFIYVCPEPPEVHELPYFDRTIGDAGTDAARETASETGAQLLTSEDGPEALAALGADARGILWPAGVITVHPRVGTLIEHLDRPEQKGYEAVGAGHDRRAIAVAGSARVLAAALRPTLDETVEALGEKVRWPPYPPHYGHKRATRDAVSAEFRSMRRIRGAADWMVVIGEARGETAGRFVDAGVLVEDPNTLWADPTCEAEAGAQIGPSVVLTGNTKIGAGARIGSFCRIENCEIAPGATILSHSVLLDSTIGREARVGPFAHIRPNTQLEQGSFAGSFVETKNAVLGRNAALPHLSYLGDAEVGTRVNLGAGTITCNYDGKNKHRTVVEAGAFIGSNAILVAPVTIGKRAFVAAGSVIVEDVPAGALAIARGRQAVKPDRATGRFEGAEEV